MCIPGLSIIYLFVYLTCCIFFHIEKNHYTKVYDKQPSGQNIGKKCFTTTLSEFCLKAIHSFGNFNIKDLVKYQTEFNFFLRLRL